MKERSAAERAVKLAKAGGCPVRWVWLHDFVLM